MRDSYSRVWCFSLLILGCCSPVITQATDTERQVITLNEAAARFDRIGMLDSAWIAADSAIRLSEGSLGPDHPVTALSLNGLAALMYNWGRIEKAESLYTRIFTIWEQHPPIDSTIYGAALYNYGTIQLEKRRPGDAVSTLTRAAVVLEAALGSRDQHVGDAYYTQGEAYRALKNCESALPAYRRSLDIRNTLEGPANLSVAQTLNSIGVCLVALDSLQEAERVYQRALTIVEQVNGPDDVASAYCMDNLARLYLRQKRYTEAERLSSLALDVFRVTPGDGSFEVAQSLALRGEIFLGSGQYDRAVESLREAEALLTSLAGPSHRAVLDVRKSLSEAMAMAVDSSRTAEAGGEPDSTAPDSE